jgi:hypothetical protein
VLIGTALIGTALIGTALIGTALIGTALVRAVITGISPGNTRGRCGPIVCQCCHASRYSSLQ